MKADVAQGTPVPPRATQDTQFWLAFRCQFGEWFAELPLTLVTRFGYGTAPFYVCFTSQIQTNRQIPFD